MVSIIIPVYNAEKYIERALESILSQNYDDYEVILVNDGSSDGTDAICRKYSEKYQKIKYFCHEEQKGASTARNTGLANASGEYLCFVDSDDELCENALKTLIDSIGECDIVIGSYYNVYANKTEPVNLKNKCYTIGEFKEKMIPIYTAGAINTVWGKLFRKTVADETKVKFDSDIMLGEDLIFVLNYLENAKTVVCIEEYIYKYHRRES